MRSPTPYGRLPYLWVGTWDFEPMLWTNLARGSGVFHPHLEFRHSFRMKLQSARASAVSPAIDTPRCSSIGRIFFWWSDSSEGALFRATRMACVFDFRPTQAEPCFTASMAYSSWWILPCGLHTVTSLSYWFLNILFECGTTSCW